MAGQLPGSSGDKGGLSTAPSGSILHHEQPTLGELVSPGGDRHWSSAEKNHKVRGNAAKRAKNAGKSGGYAVETVGFQPTDMELLDEGALYEDDAGDATAGADGADDDAAQPNEPDASSGHATDVDERSGSGDDNDDESGDGSAEYNGPRRLVVQPGGELVDPDGFVAIARIGKFEWRVAPIVESAGSESSGVAVASEEEAPRKLKRKTK